MAAIFHQFEQIQLQLLERRAVADEADGVLPQGRTLLMPQQVDNILQTSVLKWKVLAVGSVVAKSLA